MRNAPGTAAIPARVTIARPMRVSGDALCRIAQRSISAGKTESVPAKARIAIAAASMSFVGVWGAVGAFATDGVEEPEHDGVGVLYTVEYLV